MQCFYGVVLFVLIVVSAALSAEAGPPARVEITIEKENNAELDREKRQMKAGSGDAETKIFSGQAGQAAAGAMGLGAVQQNQGQLPINGGNLQFSGRYNNYGGYPIFGGYPGSASAAYPGLGVGAGIPATGVYPVNTLTGYPGSNLAGAGLGSYPGMNVEVYPGFMYGGANIYNNGQMPNNYLELQAGQNYGNVGTLDNIVNLANLQGLNPQLAAQQGAQFQLQAQQSQLQQQISPYPIMQGGYYPQMGYSPSFQRYQG